MDKKVILARVFGVSPDQITTTEPRFEVIGLPLGADVAQGTVISKGSEVHGGDHRTHYLLETEEATLFFRIAMDARGETYSEFASGRMELNAYERDLLRDYAKGWMKDICKPLPVTAPATV